MDLKENSCLSASIEIGRKRQKSVINCQPEYGIHLQVISDRATEFERPFINSYVANCTLFSHDKAILEAAVSRSTSLAQSVRRSVPRYLLSLLAVTGIVYTTLFS